MKTKIKNWILHFLKLDEWILKTDEAISSLEIDTVNMEMFMQKCSEIFHPYIEFACVEGFEPNKANKTDGGWDIKANLDLPSPWKDNPRMTKCVDENGEEFVVIPPHTTFCINSGVQINFPPHLQAIVVGKSKKNNEGLTVKRGLVDESYPEYVGISIINDTDSSKRIYHGRYYAQIQFIPRLEENLVRVPKINRIEKRAGGFGSSKNQ